MQILYGAWMVIFIAILVGAVSIAAVAGLFKISIRDEIVFDDDREDDDDV